jgi:uncharacterized protein YyaL (SSP411 family)
MHKFSNKLSEETSPYLLQHAHNPVDWFPWSEEALQKAKQENKPVLISIGYAACHWCHVMERESFEDETTAELMNEHFINIKIDREERPDLDHIYMDAVQAMTGSGGWPLNVFLTPDAKPFYGGTYFPPVRAYNRSSWKETLQSVVQAFREKRHEIDAQAENLTAHLIQSNSFGLQKPGDQRESFSKEKCDEAFENIMKSADKEWGGFGKAPKFPQTFSIQFLLRYHYVNNLQFSGVSKVPLHLEVALQQALLSLDKMIEGGIYDQAGGGFARYSTDTEWLVPHFEKMLYDNALLISVISEAYQLTKKERYKEVIEETMEFVQREMLHFRLNDSVGQAQKGFYSALDADSEGEEGKFYVWQKEEIELLLGEDAPVFCSYYDITEKGNWEEKNILRVKKQLEPFAAENNIDVKAIKEILKKGKVKLLEKRKGRVRPLLDDKIILGWNALMNTACSKAFGATGNEIYRSLAIDNMEFLLQKLVASNIGEFYHTWKNDEAKFPAFLDDYAFLIQALIHLQEITADTKWLLKAREITEFVIQSFSEPETGFFFYTKSGQQDVIIRKKEVYDGAVPSGNAVMAGNLYQLALFFDNTEWKKRSEDMISSFGQALTRYPTSFGYWNCLLLEMITGTIEIAILGTDFNKIHKELLGQFIPHRVIMTSPVENNQFPLLAEKPVTTPSSIYICKNFACFQPVVSVGEAMGVIGGQKDPINFLLIQ